MRRPPGGGSVRGAASYEQRKEDRRKSARSRSGGPALYAAELLFIPSGEAATTLNGYGTMKLYHNQLRQIMTS